MVEDAVFRELEDISERISNIKNSRLRTALASRANRVLQKWKDSQLAEQESQINQRRKII